jgi:glycosyltransferase involved in cell wall biosynthesis
MALPPPATASNARTFVVIPVLNEAPRLAETVRPLIERGYTVVVVDDCSTDETPAIASGLPVFVLRHPINLGQGAALQTGMDFAAGHGAAFVVHFDADGQHDPADIPVLVAPLAAREADVVLGSRFLQPEDAALVPRARRLLLKSAIVINGALTGIWLSDAHNGFRAMTADAARRIRLRENRFAHATEILGEIRRLRLRYVERPTGIRYTAASMAKGQSPWNAIPILLDILIRKVLR